MTILILGKRYSEREWRKVLVSNEGIFKRIPIPEKYTPGPHLREGNLIRGGELSVETVLFGKYASEEQLRAYSDIKRQSREKANQYLLTVCSAIDSWKRAVGELIRMRDNPLVKEYLKDLKRRGFGFLFT